MVAGSGGGGPWRIYLDPSEVVFSLVFLSFFSKSHKNKDSGSCYYHVFINIFKQL